MLLRTLATACIVLGLTVGVSHAGMIGIHITGLNFDFANGQIYDSANVAGGNLDTAQADAVETVDFFLDEVFVGSLTTNLYADLLVNQVPDLPKNGGVVTTGSAGSPDGVFGFDLLQGGSSPTQLLGLTFDTLDVLYGKSKIVLVGGDAQKLTAQNLPFGLQLDADDTVSISISSSNLTNLTYSNGNLSVSGFNAFGTCDINGASAPIIPEPTTLALLSLGSLMGFAMLRWRNRG